MAANAMPCLHIYCVKSFCIYYFYFFGFFIIVSIPTVFDRSELGKQNIFWNHMKKLRSDKGIAAGVSSGASPFLLLRK